MFFFVLLYAHSMAVFLVGISSLIVATCPYAAHYLSPCLVPQFQQLNFLFRHLHYLRVFSCRLTFFFPFQFHALISRCPVHSFVFPLPLQIIPHLVLFSSVRSGTLSDLSHVFFFSGVRSGTLSYLSHMFLFCIRLSSAHTGGIVPSTSPCN